jgi:hypothetical protein
VAVAAGSGTVPVDVKITHQPMVWEFSKIWIWWYDPLTRQCHRRSTVVAS